MKRQASRANGTKFGRPRKVASGEHIATAKRMKADGHTGKDIAKYLGVSRATVYRYLAEFHIGGRTCQEAANQLPKLNTRVRFPSSAPL